MSHVKNAAAFEKFIGFCSGYGGSYNPGLPNLKLSSLQEMASKARQVLEDVNVAKSALDNTTNNREIAFAGLPKLASSVIFTLASMGASEQTLKDARIYLRLITGRKLGRDPIPSESTSALAKKTKSTSQGGYVSKVFHLERLVQVVSELPTYAPNEPVLTVEGLTSTIATLKQLNAQVKDEQVALSNARVGLREVFYGNHSVVETARSGKKYVRAIFGLNSAQYGQVKKIEFTKPSVR